MILQSLVHLYDELSRQGKVAREGWGIAKVSHRLVLDEEGGLIGIVSARKKVLRGKKGERNPIGYDGAASSYPFFRRKGQFSL